MLITNDPYKTAGQLLDVTVLYPVFRNGRVIAFFGSTIHHTDVGGYGIGAGARDVFEEGLWIPICKLMIAGERNADVWKFILSNVRQPDHMAGDLHAQMASGEVGAQRLRSLCDRHGLDDIEDLADEIIDRSEAATRATHPRAAGRHVPRRSAVLDLADGSRIDIVCAVTVDTDAGEIIVDYAGSSGASPYGINVVKNYTHAYTTFTVRSVLNPELPNNHGSLAPIKVEAPEGSIVNAVSPQPCTARHVVGMFLPNALLKALAQIKPEQAMAEGSGAVWTMQVNGNHDDGRPFITAMFTYAGGVGRPGHQARPVGVLVPDRRGRRADRGGRGVGADPLPAQGAAARHRRRGRADRAASARPSSSPSTPTRPWQLNAVTVAAGRSAAGHLRRRGRRRRVVHRQRRAGPHAGPVHAAARRSSCASTSPAAAATGDAPTGGPTERPSDGAAHDRALTDELLASFDALDHRRGRRRSRCRPRSTRREEFLAFERDALFAHEWLCVGRASRIPNAGDYFTDHRQRRADHRRPRQGRRPSAPSRPSASTAACRSPTTPATAPSSPARTTSGSTTSTGRLLGAPAMERTDGFDKKDYPLPALAVELWQGFVFVNFDPDAAPLGADAAPATSRTSSTTTSSDAVCPGTFTLTDLPWNWKVMFENFNDGYHANQLHHTIQDFCPSELAAFPVRVGRRRRTSSSAPTATPTSTAGSTPRPRRCCRCSRSSPRRSAGARRSRCMPPTLCFGTAPDQAFFFIVRPKTADTIDVEIGYLFHPSALEHPMFDHLLQMSDAGVQVFVRQDQDATTKVQRGMHSRFAARGRYSWQEASHVQFNRWLVQRYRRHWPTIATDLIHQTEHQDNGTGGEP